VQQALVALRDSPIVTKHSPSDLQGYVFGDQIGTTSLAFINSQIKPDEDAEGLQQPQRRQAGRQSTGPVMLPLRIVALVYVDVFRGVPLILLIFAAGFGLPALQLTVVSTQDPAVYGVLALVLSYSAYVSEVYRAGIGSVPLAQVSAARSVGLTHVQALRYVILPQAVRTILPPLLNDFISLQKDTALVSVLGSIEANRAAQIYSDTTFNYSSYVVAAALFLILTIPLARFTDHLIGRDRRRRLAGGTIQ